MGSVEDLSKILQLTEVKKQRVQESILSLLIEWKGFEECVDSTHHSFKLCAMELEAREKDLMSEQEKLAERMKVFECNEKEKMELLRSKEGCIEFGIKSLGEKMEKNKLRTEELNSQERLLKKIAEKFGLKEEEWRRVGDLVTKRFEEIKSNEKSIEIREIQLDSIVSELDMQQQSVLNKEKELEMKEMDLYSIQKTNEGKSEQLLRKEVQLDAKEKELDSKEKNLDSVKKFTQDCFKEYRAKKKELDLERKLVEERSKELESKENDLREMTRSFDLKQQEIHSINIANEERGRDLEIREKQLQDQLKEFELNEKQFKERVTGFDLKEKEIDSLRTSCEERCLQLDTLERDLDKRMKEFELKEKNFSKVVNTSVKTEPAEDGCSFADIRFFVTMNGKELQLYLCERERDLDSMGDEVSKVLRHSLDPAKLVLDAMEGFYPPHLRKGDKEFGAEIVRRSCIILLEQLRRISPRITRHVKQAALRVAGEWKEKTVARVDIDALEVIGLLQLLACYGLHSAVEPCELISLVDVIGQEEIYKLCQVLGFTDKLSDHIQNLIEKNDHLQAIRLICSFGLTEKFPPVPLLKAYLRNSEEIANKILEEGKNSKDAQSRAINEELVALREASNCIKKHQLEKEYPLEKLFERIEQLERQNTNTNQQVVVTKDAGPKSTPRAALNSSSGAHGTFKKRHHGRKRPRVEPPKGAATHNSTVVAYPPRPWVEPPKIAATHTVVAYPPRPVLGTQVMQGNVYAAQAGPNVMEQRIRPYSLGGMIPSMPYQYRPTVAADGTSMLAGFGDRNIGLPGNFNQQRPALTGTPFMHHFGHNRGFQGC